MPARIVEREFWRATVSIEAMGLSQSRRRGRQALIPSIIVHNQTGWSLPIDGHRYSHTQSHQPVPFYVEQDLITRRGRVAE